MVFQSLTFNELTPTQVYEILRARCEVFMVEQRIVCQDMDRVDYQSRHLFLEEDGAVVAYLRAYYIDPETVQLGRVLTLRHGVGQGRCVERSGRNFGRCHREPPENFGIPPAVACTDFRFAEMEVV